MQRFCINDSINILRNIEDVHRNLSQFNMDVESGGGGRKPRDTSTYLNCLRYVVDLFIPLHRYDRTNINLKWPPSPSGLVSGHSDTRAFPFLGYGSTRWTLHAVREVQRFTASTVTTGA